ncbi:MAG: 23S rRNA (uracil(1939)-C(5))-methyltransferase RlmD [Candidatus Saccharicenans sp.]
MRVVLASESPRRIRLLKRIFRSFSVIPSGFDEKQFVEKDPAQFALKVAEAKARKVAEEYPEAVVIAADTVVTIDGLILGKPKDREEARKMLETLSGRTHQVITAVVIYQQNQNKLLSDFEISQVTFKPLKESDLELYLDKDTYSDKAGAYAIQEIKDTFLERLEGDYNNVVGLPIQRLRRLLHRFLEEKTELEIDSFLLPEGLGVAEQKEHTYFVPGAYPGDRVEIAFESSSHQNIRARLISIIRPSPHRQPAPCPHFGRCGGCNFQDLAYREQLRQKKLYLLRVFKDYLPASYRYLEVEDVLPSPDEYYYRNKMEFSFGQQENEIFLGLKKKNLNKEHRKNKKVIPLEKCLLSTPLTEKLFPLFAELVKSSKLPVFDLNSKKGFFRHLVIREGKQTRQLMLLLVTTSQAQLDLSGFTERLFQAVPQLKSFWWVENNRIADVVSLEKMHLLYGTEAIEENLLGYRFKIYPGSFFQTNPRAAQVVYSKIAEEAKRLRTQSALGLYCGSGAIEICLSKVAGEVVGVDWDPASIKAARENVRINNLNNVRFEESSVENILPEIYRGAFDLLLIDPPRAGISPKGLRQIASLQIPNLIYLSCNPVTLARDLNFLGSKGYRINRLIPVDFFPHTPHLEVLAFLSR